MTRLTMVVAIDAGRGIGVNNQLPWHLPEDLAHFKRVTLGRPLPGRQNIVVTRNADWQHEGVDAVTSLDAAIAMVEGDEASIIGGAQIFSAVLDVADRMIVTEIAHTFACDTFFPAIDPAVWEETARETHHSDKNGYGYAFVTYERKPAA